MKKYILLVLISFNFQFIHGQSGWYHINPVFSSMGFEDIKIINPSTAYAIGGFSSFMKTTDAGLTWSNGVSSSEFTGMTPERLFGIYFINQYTGWAVGNNNTEPQLRIFKTTNEGNNWFRQGLELGNAYLEDVYFINENTGWIAGNNKIYKTTNSGENWLLIPLPNNTQLSSIYFFDAKTGFTTGGAWVYKTVNGGENWSSTYYGVNSHYFCIRFINQSTGFIVGLQYNNQYSKILKTTNGGNDWSLKYDMPYGQLNSIQIISTTDLVAVGGSFTYSTEKILKSTDTGETWLDVGNTISPSVLMATAFFNMNTGIALGNNGKMIRTTNTGITWNSINASFNNDYINFVNFSNNNSAFLLCNNGKIIRTNNGGNSWDSLSIPGNDNLLWGSFFGNYYYVNSQSKFYRSADNGTNWTILNTGRTMAGMDFINQNEGFMVGYVWGYFFSHTTLFKSTNSGISWDTSAVLPSNRPSSFKFINSQTGFISGGSEGINNYILKTTNGGVNWIQKYSGEQKRPRCIFFVNDNTGYISCDYNLLLKTINGGENWQSLTFGMADSWYSPKIQFMDNNSGFALINYPSSQILKTTDGGLNWHIQFDCGISFLNSFSFTDNNTGYAAGHGVILKTTNGGQYITNLINYYSELPITFYLSQNYPNPFNPVTNIKFDIPKSGFVKITIFDLLGREITTLVNQQMKPGSYNVDWDASNYPSGVYFYKLVSENFSESKKMILIK